MSDEDIVGIYLAHSSHEQAQGKVIEARLIALDKHIRVYNPFDKENPAYEELHNNIKKGLLSDAAIGDQMTDEFAKWILDVDLEGIRKQDVLVAILPEPEYHSVGGICEIFFASYILNMPVFIYTPKHLINHPWLIALSDALYDDLDEFFTFLEVYLDYDDLSEGATN